MATVTFEHVNKRFGDFIAVNDLNLEIGDGEFMVLVGPSGCGKTTSLRMIAGLEEVSEGTLRIGDRVVNDVAPKDRDIAMVFQSYALYPHMSVRDNLAFGLKLRKVPKPEIERRVKEAADTIQLTNLLDRKPKELSGGQRQRVALGRAIVREPAVFLMDEPLSNLDAKLRVEMRAELKRLHRQLNTTTIYVTHDQEEAMTLGDRIVVMKDGVVHQCGAPLEVYSRPVNRFVAGFVGTPPMNFLNGRLVGRNGGVYLDEGSTQIRLSDSMSANLGAWVGKDVVLGVRPEGISTRAENRFAGTDNVLPIQIVVVEPLGEKMDLYTATPKHPHIVARIDAQPELEAGQQIRLHLDMSKVHVFQPGDAGANLSLGAGNSGN